MLRAIKRPCVRIHFKLGGLTVFLVEHLFWTDTFCQRCSRLTPGTLTQQQPLKVPCGHALFRRAAFRTECLFLLHEVSSFLKLCILLMTFKTKIDYT